MIRTPSRPTERAAISAALVDEIRARNAAHTRPATRRGSAIRRVIAAATIAGAVCLPTIGTADPAAVIPPGAVSQAMNDELSALGYDDTTRPVPRSIAVQACHTDTDCAIASGDPIGAWAS